MSLPREELDYLDQVISEATNEGIFSYRGDADGANGQHVHSGEESAPDHDQVPAKKKADHWGEPIPLDVHVAPCLPDAVFTGWLGDQIDAVAQATETPRELAASFALSVLGTICQKRFSVRPEPGYFEPLNVWTICALESGNRKSANMRAMVAPVISLEKRLRAEAVAEVDRKKSERKTLEARISQLRDKAKKTDDAEAFETLKEQIAKTEAELPEVPQIPRLFGQDVTPEHIGTMLADNGERFALLSDEGGIFDIIGGRYSGGVPNMDVFLQSHSGSTVRVDRGSRPPVILDHPALTIGLSPQPDVLRGLVDRPGFRGRGLLARFLYLVPNSRLGQRDLVSRPIPDPIRHAYESAITALADVPPKMDGDQPVPYVLTLSPEALATWKQFQRSIEEQLRDGGRLENLKDWGGKLPGAAARLAGLLHCAEYAWSVSDVREIGGDTMGRAVRLSEYLVSHAMIVFDLMGADEEMDAAKALWKVIEGKRAEEITARDAWHPLRGKYKRMADVEPGFDLLIERGYIYEPHQADYQRSGRPSRKFIVNPRIVEQWK